MKSGRSEDYSIDGSTIGGHLRLHSLEYYGFGATTAVYFATGTGLNDKNDPNTIMAAGRFFTIENKSIANLRIRTWNFYAYDIMNMFYLDCDFKDKFNSSTYTLSGQYLRVDAVGDDLAQHFMDSSSAYLMGLKASIEYKKSLFYLAYNHSGNAKILNPWGGDPAYTSSIFTRNAYRANVDAYKIGFNYNLLKNLKFISSYANYGKSTTLGTFSPSKPVEVVSLARGDASEYNILFSYNPIKELNILAAIIYRESEYFYADKQVELLDVDLIVTYSF